jgi:hypothetical protein
MDRIILATVPSTASLPEALASIHPNTRAIVVVGSEGALLVTAGDIMSAMNDALDSDRKPKDVKVGQVILAQAPLKTLKSFPLRVGVDFGPVGSRVGVTYDETPQFETFFADNDHRHIVEQIGPDTATVVTASERFAGDLGKSVIICVCAGDPKHSFEPDQVRVPGTCNKPHAKKVTCGEANEQ